MRNDAAHVPPATTWLARVIHEFMVHWLWPVAVLSGLLVLSYRVFLSAFPSVPNVLRCVLCAGILWLPVRLAYARPLLGYSVIVRATALWMAAVMSIPLVFGTHYSLALVFWVIMGLVIGLTPRQVKCREKSVE